MLHGDNTPASPSIQIIQFPLGLLRNTRGARPLTLGPCPDNVLGQHRDVTWSRRPGDKSLFTRAQTWTKPRKLSRSERPGREPGLSGQISAITDYSNCHTSNLRAQCYFECHAISFVVIAENIQSPVTSEHHSESRGSSEDEVTIIKGCRLTRSPRAWSSSAARCCWLSSTI